MEVIRFINEQPVSAIPPMKVANEGVIQLIREVQSRAVRARPQPPKDEPKPETSPIAG